METREPLGFISLNGRGLGEARKRQRLIGWLNKFHNATNKIIILQETHSTLRTEKQWENDWEGNHVFFSHGDSSSRGVVTIIPKSLKCKIIDTITSTNGRYIALKIVINNVTYG